MEALFLPLAGLVVLSMTMAAAWSWQRRSRNAGVVDVLWAGGIGVLAVAFTLLADGWGPRRLLAGLLAAAWSARLTWHLARRVRAEAEDGRYTALRERWGERFQPLLFWFFQAQALLAVVLSLAFLVLASAPDAGWRAIDLVAVALWFVSVGGESLADRQLRAWRADPANRGRTCRSGLWAYSRHPNYFFEWLHWLVYPLLGIGLPLGWTLWLVPALMLLLVLEVTGIPPTEEQSVRSRGDDYRDYQRTTNAFFPGPRREARAHLPEES
jgi:steroid 5-alpha reductase family enzyme